MTPVMVSGIKRTSIACRLILEMGTLGAIELIRWLSRSRLDRHSSAGRDSGGTRSRLVTLVTEQDTFPIVVERLLRTSQPKIEIINLGVSAWGPADALAYLEIEGKDIRSSAWYMPSSQERM